MLVTVILLCLFSVVYVGDLPHSIRVHLAVAANCRRRRGRLPHIQLQGNVTEAPVLVICVVICVSYAYELCSYSLNCVHGALIPTQPIYAFTPQQYAGFSMVIN